MTKKIKQPVITSPPTISDTVDIIYAVSKIAAVSLRQEWAKPRLEAGCRNCGSRRDRCHNCLSHRVFSKWKRLRRWTTRDVDVYWGCGVGSVSYFLLREDDELELSHWRGFSHQSNDQEFHEFLFREFAAVCGADASIDDLISDAFARGIISTDCITDSYINGRPTPRTW